MKRIASWLLVLLLVSGCISMVACGGGIPQEDYDAVVEERDAAQAQILSLRGDLDEAESEIDSLTGELATLNDDLATATSQLAECDELSAEYDELSAKYSQLNSQYNELSAKYDTLLTGNVTISEEDLEQLVFDLINQERQDNGLKEIEWYDGLHSVAKGHSRHLATIKSLEYSEYSVWQECFIAIGYSTSDRIVNAALTTWKLRPQYELNFLNEAAKYGAVGVIKADEGYYITYVSHSSYLR